MITIELSDIANQIHEEDLSPIVNILYQSLSFDKIYKRESLIDYKEGIIELFIELLRKTLAENGSLSKLDKINLVDFLDKLKTQKEYIEIMKLNSSKSDLAQASERLGKKSQSSFGE